MKQNIDITNYDRLVEAVAEQAFVDYVHSRKILEKNKVKKVKYKPETIARAEAMIAETKDFFGRELIQKLYPRHSVDGIISILEERVVRELEEEEKQKMLMKVTKESSKRKKALK